MSSNSSSGSISNPSAATTTGFLTSLWVNAAVFGLEILAFSLLRTNFRAIYEPRTYLLPAQKRSPLLVKSRAFLDNLLWPYRLFTAPYEPLKYKAGLDAYFFVRFLRMMVKILFPIWIISWIVLLPLTSVGTGTGANSGLALFTFGNVSPGDQVRYAGHLVLVWGFTFWVFHNIRREMRHFVITRQLHLVSPAHRSTAQANTVLITGIPSKYLSEKRLAQLFDHLPGGVRKVWVNRNLKELPDLYERRLAACNLLESAETKLIKTALKIRRKQVKKAEKERVKYDKKHNLGNNNSKSSHGREDSPTSTTPFPHNSNGNGNGNEEEYHMNANRELTEEEIIALVPRKKRPTHRLPLAGFLPSLPLVGREVDSIEWARREIRETTEGLERGRGVLRREAGAEALGEVDAERKRRARGQGGVVGFVGGLGVGEVVGGALGGVGGVVRRVPGVGTVVGGVGRVRGVGGFGGGYEGYDEDMDVEDGDGDGGREVNRWQEEEGDYRREYVGEEEARARDARGYADESGSANGWDKKGGLGGREEVREVRASEDEDGNKKGGVADENRVIATSPNANTNANANAVVPSPNAVSSPSSPPDPAQTASETETYPPTSSAFLLFRSQYSAHLASQVLLHNEPYRMTAAGYSIEVAPADVIWGNLGLNPYEVRVREAIGWGVTVGLIVVWAIPVAFIGALSNISHLCVQYSWLAWLCTIPKTLLGIIQGILPPVLLAVLMLLLPIVLRLIVRMEGVTRRTGVEMAVMTRFFIFEVIHGFLIVTLSGGLISALPSLLNNPGSIPSLLAQYLPSASNFFLTYVILQGLSGTGSGFLQIVSMVLYYLKLFVLGSKPRSIYNIKYTMNNVKWGTLFPSTTLIVVITFGYSIISPIINGLAFVTFFLFFEMYKYLFLYVYDQPAAGDTGGLFFPMAIQHMFVGLYVQQICLAALFFLARDENKKPSAVPEGALMVVLIFFTLFFQMILSNSYSKLITKLPLTLVDRAYTHQSPTVSAGASPRPSRPISPDYSVRGGTGAAGYNVSPEMVLETAEANGMFRDRHDDDGEAPPRFSDVNGAAPTYRDDVDVEQQRPSHEQHLRGDMTPTSGTYSNPRSAEEEVDDEPKDFFHPAVVEAQRVIWIPNDESSGLGLAEREVAACESEGVRATCKGANVDWKGRVTVGGEEPL